MGRGAPLRWIENQILRTYVHGRGIEIGALWKRFPIPGSGRVWYADRLSLAGLEDHYADLKGSIISPDVIADAEALPFNGSLDFIIASHVLEHLHFPLAALRVWCNALMPGGILLLRVPDKRFTFDAPRQRTSLDHLILEDAAPEAYDPGRHYADWVEHIHKASPTQSNFAPKVKELLDRKFSIHFHVWTDVDVREILNYTIDEWRLPWRPVFSLQAHFYRKEAVVVLQKDTPQAGFIRPQTFEARVTEQGMANAGLN